MTLPFFTIGHSTRTVEAFLNLLRVAEVTVVADIRSVPRSKTNPQYNYDLLPETLAASQVGYEHIAELGGLRGKSKTAPPHLNGFWENQSFHNYADYAMSDEFRSGLARLRSLGHAKTSVLMCSEAVWWRCHRRIIADYLIAAGETVFHILGANHVAPAHLTAGAVFEMDGSVTYPGLSSG